MIGLDRFAGYFGSDAVTGWAQSGRALATVPQLTARELAAQKASGAVAIIDVRGRAEWEAGHLPGVPNIPVGYLVERLAEIPRDRPVVVQCQGGTRVGDRGQRAPGARHHRRGEFLEGIPGVGGLRASGGAGRARKVDPVSLRFVLAMAGALAGSAHRLRAQETSTSETIQSPLGDSTRYREAITAFQKAVKAHDAAGVAALVRYPIKVRIGGSRRTIKTPQTFIAKYDSIITPAIAAAVQDAT